MTNVNVPMAVLAFSHIPLSMAALTHILYSTHPVRSRSLCGGSGARFFPPLMGQGLRQRNDKVTVKYITVNKRERAQL